MAGTGTGPLARLCVEDPRHALGTVPVASGCERIRSGGGGRRADSSRGGAGIADLHTFNYKRGHPASPTAYYVANRQARAAHWVYRACISAETLVVEAPMTFE